MVRHYECSIIDPNTGRVSYPMAVEARPLGDDRYQCPTCKRTFLHIGSGPGTGPVMKSKGGDECTR